MLHVLFSLARELACVISLAPEKTYRGGQIADKKPRFLTFLENAIKIMADDCKIYVGFLSDQTDDKSLTSHFQEIGEVVDGEWK